MNTDLTTRQSKWAQEQESGSIAGVRLPRMVRCHQCGSKADVPRQRVYLNPPHGQMQGYDQQDRHEGYLIAIECPNCGQVKQRLTADDA